MAAKFSVRAKGFHTMLVKVTPQMAEEMLEHNDGNRAVSHVHVDGLGRDMVAGRWRQNGDTIKIAPNGRLLDGQHRLRAVLQAKRTIEFLVAFNVQEEAMESIDRNRGRSLADLLRINRGVQYATCVSATARTIARIEGGYETALPRLTYGELDDLYERFKVDIEWAIDAIGQTIEPGIPSGGAVVLGAFAFMRPVHKSVEQMATRFHTGEVRGKSDPASALRGAVAHAHAKSSHTRRELTLKALRAIEAELSGEQLLIAKVDGGIFERAVAARNGLRAA